MSVLTDLTTGCDPVSHHRPWPRFRVVEESWQAAAHALSSGQLDLLGLWGERDAVHMALRDIAAGDIAVLTLPTRNGGFPSVGASHAPAIRLERAAADLYGLKPIGTPDPRPWLDHGVWEAGHPAGALPDPESRPAYDFLSAVGESLHQIPVGPVHAGIIEPGHFRFTASGETIVRLEERLGYTHKGIEHLLAGSDLMRAARIASRTSGDSTVAYGLAFATAIEAAAAVEAPPRAVLLRALAAEIERLANHLGDIGAICNDAAFAIMHAHCGALRERILRVCDETFGHRMMRDLIVPGGVSADLPAGGAERIRSVAAAIGSEFPRLVELYDKTSSLQDRTVSTGRLTADLARRFGAGGYVGRASGRSFDARRAIAYAPYDSLDFEVPVLSDGDVNARVWIRIREVESAISLIGQILDMLPQGPILAEVAVSGETGEGMSLVEGFRGDILAWVRLGPSRTVGHCHLRDPSWFQWPLLEAVIEGNIVADFPLCNKSFNCSYSGHDL